MRNTLPATCQCLHIRTQCEVPRLSSPSQLHYPFIFFSSYVFRTRFVFPVPLSVAFSIASSHPCCRVPVPVAPLICVIQCLVLSGVWCHPAFGAIRCATVLMMHGMCCQVPRDNHRLRGAPCWVCSSLQWALVGSNCGPCQEHIPHVTEPNLSST